MKFERGYAQHVGSRNEQQDAGLVLADERRGEQLVVVADGMGGHAGGSIAAAQVAETARRIWAEHQKSPLEPKRLLERIIREGHEAINKAGAEKGLTPRSTCALLFLHNGSAHWAHVGDSRIYRLHDGQVARLTRDHSVVQMLVDLGKVAEEEMGTHPDQNRLTQSLGGDAMPMPDFGNDAVTPHDAFLVCTDGLWEMIPQSEMAAALAARKLGDDGAKHLAERAFDRAKPKSDNITVAMLRVGGPPPGSIGVDFDEARTTRMPGATTRRTAGRARWGFVAATVVALGAAAAVVYKPWEKNGVEPGTTPAAGPKEKPGDGTAPTPPEKRTEPPKQEGEPKPAERREGPPRAVPPAPPAQPAPGDRGAAPDNSKPADRSSGGEPDKKQAQPRPAQPKTAKPKQAAPRQSGIAPPADARKNEDPAQTPAKPPEGPSGPGQDSDAPKPQ